MKNLFENIKVKRHYLLMEEQDVTSIVAVINQQTPSYNSKMYLGNCGWVEELTTWFVHFDASDKKWGLIVSELDKKGFEIILVDEKNLFIRKRG